MGIDRQKWYAAFKARDARFDGRFFVGVLSTGIYCRPVCRAKPPKAENCVFYPSAAAAERAGFRPCLLCRPELAPGNAPLDAASALALRAAKFLEADCGGGQSLEELAARMGCTARHLRRVFTAQYHVPPVQYRQTCRLLLAKKLLTDTGLPVLEVAMAAGFGSLRRFNHLFKTSYRLSPAALRGRKAADNSITLALGYRPPYQWRQILDFLSQRALAGVEAVKDNSYLRTVRLPVAGQKYVSGWIRVGHQPEKNALSLSMDTALLPVLPQVLARVGRLFDLNCQPEAIYARLASMNDIRSGLCLAGIRLPGSFEPFETAARAVLGQQITVKAAATLAARLVAAFGVQVPTGIEGLSHAFPTPESILALSGPIDNHFGPLGIIRARANTIRELARAVLEGRIEFGLCARPEAEIEKLCAIAGIGPWTAQYIAMRAMEWPDAFLETDAGVRKALAPRTSKQLLQMAEAWRPWRSYATINLWQAI